MWTIPSVICDRDLRWVNLLICIGRKSTLLLNRVEAYLSYLQLFTMSLQKSARTTLPLLSTSVRFWIRFLHATWHEIRQSKTDQNSWTTLKCGGVVLPLSHWGCCLITIFGIHKREKGRRHSTPVASFTFCCVTSEVRTWHAFNQPL
jgi:hypothetical protein